MEIVGRREQAVARTCAQQAPTAEPLPNLAIGQPVESVSRNFHEQLTEDEIPLPSERSTGLVFAVVFLIVAVVWRASPYVAGAALLLSACLATISVSRPSLLGFLNRIWFSFGLLLGRIVSPVVLFVLFAFVMLPFGLIMQLFRDPLQKKRSLRGSYWINRSVDSKTSMANPF